MTDEKRAYRMTVRAELQQRTRRRITESAAELHGTIGPARTSMSAVAARAGVRRSTLYRHFPDEAALFAACSSHWAAQHPLPALEVWARIRDPELRLRTALGELYGFYERGEPMLANLVRDLELVEAIREPFSHIQRYLATGREVLMVGRRGRGRRTRRAEQAIGHALAFTTWRSLVREQGCSREEAVALMSRLP